MIYSTGKTNYLPFFHILALVLSPTVWSLSLMRGLLVLRFTQKWGEQCLEQGKLWNRGIFCTHRISEKVGVQVDFACSVRKGVEESVW